MDDLALIQGALLALEREIQYINGMAVGMRGNMTGVAIAASAVAGLSNKYCNRAVKSANLAANELTNIQGNLIAARDNLRAYINSIHGA